MKTLGIWLIALTLIAANLQIYRVENGYNIFFGGLGYHIETESES